MEQATSFMKRLVRTKDKAWLSKIQLGHCENENALCRVNTVGECNLLFLAILTIQLGTLVQLCLTTQLGAPIHEWEGC
jgi:hypothetical protein